MRLLVILPLMLCKAVPAGSRATIAAPVAVTWAGLTKPMVVWKPGGPNSWK